MLTGDNIEELKQRVEKFRSTGISERRTREQLINLTLRFLGWDVSNYRRVNTEHSITGPGGAKESRVDYALFAENGNPAVFVEAKRLDGIGEGSVKQLRRYAFEEVARKGTRNLASLVLTDGNVWKFYPLSHGRGIDYHPNWCHTLNLEAGEAYQIKKDLNNLLDIQKVSSGESSKYLERLFRLDRTKKACESMLARPPETLLELIEKEMAEDDCESDREEIKRILSGICASGREFNPSVTPVEAPSSKEGENPRRPAKWKLLRVEYDGKIFEGEDATLILNDVLTLLADTCGGMGKVAEACKGLATNPLVMTVEEAHEFMRVKKSYKTKAFSDPKYSDYEYFFTITNVDKKRRLEDLAKKLGISERVKVEVVDWVSQS